MVKQAFYQWLLKCKDAKIQASKEKFNQKEIAHRIHVTIDSLLLGRLQSAFTSIQTAAYRRYCFSIVCDKANKRLHYHIQQKLAKWKMVKDAYSRDERKNKLLGISSILLSFKRWAFINLRFAADERTEKIRDLFINLQTASHQRMSFAFLRWKQLLDAHFDKQCCQLTTNLIRLLAQQFETSVEPIFTRETSLETRKRAIM